MTITIIRGSQPGLTYRDLTPGCAYRGSDGALCPGQHLRITMPAWLWRLKWVAYFSEVVATPADRPNGVLLASNKASS